jgi:hypothetical protein
MRPAQFVTQCVTNRECPVKQAHVAQVGSIEPASELCGQSVREARQKAGTERGAPSAMLLEFDDMPAYLPAGLHLHGIHRPQRLLPGLLDQPTQGSQQRSQSGFG